MARIVSRRDKEILFIYLLMVDCRCSRLVRRRVRCTDCLPRDRPEPHEKSESLHNLAAITCRQGVLRGQGCMNDSALVEEAVGA